MKKCVLPLLPGLIFTTALAQPKPTLTTEDYGKWERLRTGRLSPDGQWLAVLIDRVNEENELRIRRVGSDTLKTVAYAANPTFSDDSRWLAYSIGVSVSQREKMRKTKNRSGTNWACSTSTRSRS